MKCKKAPLNDSTARPCVVVGSSSGARTALLLAHRHPDAVAGLVLAREKGLFLRTSILFI